VSGALGLARDALAECPDWSAEALETAARAAADALGWKAGDSFRPIRLAVTGKSVSPPLFGSLELLGRDRSLLRLDAAIERLGAGATA
jgi:glutamyl-tRNA synthetase